MNAIDHKNNKKTKTEKLGYKEKLKSKMDQYVCFVYEVTRNFPKEELYCTVSQFRRASMSIILNYIEGYARKKTLVQLNFYEISYGSLQESKYLLEFSFKQKYISLEESKLCFSLVDEIGAMLWTEIANLEKSIKG